MATHPALPTDIPFSNWILHFALIVVQSYTKFGLPIRSAHTHSHMESTSWLACRMHLLMSDVKKPLNSLRLANGFEGIVLCHGNIEIWKPPTTGLPASGDDRVWSWLIIFVKRPFYGWNSHQVFWKLRAHATIGRNRIQRTIHRTLNIALISKISS